MGGDAEAWIESKRIPRFPDALETTAPENFSWALQELQSCFMSDTQILKDTVTMDGGSPQSVKGASSSQ